MDIYPRYELCLLAMNLNFGIQLFLLLDALHGASLLKTITSETMLIIK